MPQTPSRRIIALMSLAAAMAALAPDALAQSSPPAGAQVSGAQLQAWLDAGFSYAGVHKASQCVVLNVATAGGRALLIRCPNGWTEKIPGTARIDGDRYCTRFPIPNTPAGEDCVTWHSLGAWRFEQRKGEALDTSVILLPQGLHSTP